MLPLATLPNENIFSEYLLAEAFKSWRDLQKLGCHPLASLGLVREKQRQTKYPDGVAGRGLALKEVLLEAIELLKPENSPPNFQDREWYEYLILHEQYINGRKQTFVMDQFPLPQRTYYHYRSRAFNTILNILQENEIRLSARQ